MRWKEASRTSGPRVLCVGSQNHDSLRESWRQFFSYGSSLQSVYGAIKQFYRARLLSSLPASGGGHAVRPLVLR